MPPQRTEPSSFSPSVTTGAAILNFGGSIFEAAMHQGMLATGLSILAAMLLSTCAVYQWYLFAKAYIDFCAVRPQPEEVA